jgi:ankyrin repeat protein
VKASVRTAGWAAALLTTAAGAAFADNAPLTSDSSATASASLGSAAAPADVDARGPDGATALLGAVHQGDAGEVARLIKAGANVSLANNYGATPMSEAAVAGDVAILKLLLKAGADVNSPNAEGETALMEVARTGNVDAAKLLLSHGAKVDAVEQWGGQTALIWAAAQNQPEMVKLLIKHGANVNVRSVVRDWQRKVTAEGRPKDMNRGGLTPLLYAAREGNIECAKNLLAGGADINLTDPENTSALLLALINIRWDFAKFIIFAGADVQGWDFWGQTPLYVAVDMNTIPAGGRVELPPLDKTTGLEVIELLLKDGANANAQLKLRPPYRHAIFDRNADAMLTTGATPLLRAAKVGDTGAIKLLLAHGALVDLPNQDGVTPLLAAAGAGRNTSTTRGRFKTEKDAIAAVELLKAAGADINAATKAGETVLHSSALRGWSELTKLLVASGADPNAAAKSGLTPLDFAMGRYQPGFLEPKPRPREDTAAVLRQLGATVEHTNLPPWPGIPTPTITASVPE